MNKNLSLCAQERIRLYDEFKRKIDVLNAIERQSESFRRFLDGHGRTNYWMITSSWEPRPIFKVELLKDEPLSGIGWLISGFEDEFGEVTSTEDETEYESMTRRRFITPQATLIVEIPMGSLTCKRVPTGEVEVVKKYRLECAEVTA